MFDCYITFRSITHAQRGSRVLENARIAHQLLRTPKAMAAQGCGYSLQLDFEMVQPAVEMLHKSAVPFQRVYCSGENGQYQEYLL